MVDGGRRGSRGMDGDLRKAFESLHRTVEQRVEDLWGSRLTPATRDRILELVVEQVGLAMEREGIDEPVPAFRCVVDADNPKRVVVEQFDAEHLHPLVVAVLEDLGFQSG